MCQTREGCDLIVNYCLKLIFGTVAIPSITMTLKDGFLFRKFLPTIYKLSCGTIFRARMSRRLWILDSFEEDCVEHLDRGWYEFQSVPLQKVILGLCFDSASTICVYVILELRRMHILCTINDPQISKKMCSEMKRTRTVLRTIG